MPLTTAAALSYLVPTLIAGGQAGASLFESSRNRRMQSAQNVSDRMYQNEVYSWQRRDALADQKHLEDYNSPLAQRKRMEDAGLSPALMYANNGPVGTTEMPRGSQPMGGSQPAPKIDTKGLQAALGSFMTYIGQQAQTDNLRAQNDLIKAQIQLAAAQTGKTTSETDTNKFNLGVSSQLRDQTIAQGNLTTDQMKLKNQQLEQSIQIEFDANERAKLKNSTDVTKTLEEIRSIRQQRLFELQRQPGVLHKQDAEIKKLELEMSHLDEQIQMLDLANKYRDRNEKLDQLTKEYETLLTLIGVRPNDGDMQIRLKRLESQISGLLEEIQKGFSKIPKNE